MAIYFTTEQPQSLLAKFDAAISQTEPKGKITTWIKSNDGKYYTHKSEEWGKKAWLKPAIETKRLAFNIVRPQNANVSSSTYAYYHGHLIETFLNHFDGFFTDGIASALPRSGDDCNA